jgi:NusA-like KH domain protein
MREFDNDIIKIINAFENMTGSHVRDCINSESVYFLVNPGNVAIAIGKNGQTVKSAERSIRKTIKIYEWAENPEQFIKNLVPSAQKIDISGVKATISVSNKDRGAVIGKSGSNIKIIRELLERNSPIRELKIL